MEEFNYQELQQATGNFSLENLIGKGSHGNVYKGTLKDGRVVAVKRQSSGLRKLQDNSKLENEIRVLSTFQSSRSDHFVPLLGTSRDDVADNCHVIVMKHMPHGTLHDLLHSANSFQPLTWHKRVLTALQLARALRFLHGQSPKIVHRDVKSANILFDSGWNARLADFGLATTISGNSSSQLSTQPAGTMGYLDPWYTTPGELSTKIDVFSFGVVLLEIISRTKAIEVSRRPAFIADWATALIGQNRFSDIYDINLLIPPHSRGIIKQIIRIAGRCVSSNKRPTMEEIVTEIESLYYYIERVRFPTWTNIFNVLQNKQHMIRVKRRIICSSEEANSNCNTSKGKMLLREVLSESQ